MTPCRIIIPLAKYWRPGENYLSEIGRILHGKIVDGDIIVISEKAISTSTGNLIDESTVRAHLGARLIARLWMRLIWGWLLSTLCHFKRKLKLRLQNYPVDLGSVHKQVALDAAGLLQALMFGSEGAIDSSNLAYSFVSLPLKDASEIADRIRLRIRADLKKQVTVMIVDTDKTYSFGNFHFTPRPGPLKGIYSFGGVLTYIVGRTLRMKRQATPLAVSGRKMPIEKALELAESANRARGSGTGQTVWDMAEVFHTDLTSVSWEMLETARHKPIVIFRESW